MRFPTAGSLRVTGIVAVVGMALGLVPAFAAPALAAPALAAPTAAMTSSADRVPAAESVAPVPGVLAVRFTSSSPARRARSLAAAAASAAGDGDTGGWTVVSTTGDLAAAKARLATDANIAAVSYVYRRHAFDTRPLVPNDPEFRTGHEPWLDASYFRAAWRVAATGRREVVAVIDSGVDLRQPDLRGRLVPGYDFLDNDDHPQDQLGHGTMVAGIIAAQAGNGYGIAGAAPNAMIMPLRVLDAAGNGDDIDIVRAIHWAVDHGASVINMSLGGPEEDPFLDSAVAYATSHHVVVVAAAGNVPGPGVSYPAASPGAIAVGAVDGRNRHASFSTTGAYLTLSAPGVDITSLGLGGGTATGSGTSFAAPMVAAAAALALGVGLSPADMAAQLCHRARDAGAPGRDDVFGCGVLDAGAVVGAHLNLPLNTALASALPGPIADVTVTGINGAAVLLRWRWPAQQTALAGLRVVAMPSGRLATGVRPLVQDFARSLAWNGTVSARPAGILWLPRTDVDWKLRLFAMAPDGRAMAPVITSVAGVRLVLGPPHINKTRTRSVIWQAVTSATATGRKTRGRIAAMWVRSPAATTWTRIPVITDPGGSVHYTTARPTRFLLLIRTTPSGRSPGDTTVVTVMPPARVSLTVHTTTSGPRTRVVATGTVHLGVRGTTVWLQALSSVGGWVTVATRRLQADHSYRFDLTRPRSARSIMRTIVAATRNNAVSTSPPVTYATH